MESPFSNEGNLIDRGDAMDTAQGEPEASIS
jgi:hypothetical protein